MQSVLFRLGSFTVHSYGVCMAFGILSAYWVLLKLGRRAGLDEGSLGNLVVLLVFSGLAGARLFYVAEHWAWYARDPVSALRLWEGGLMFYGSIAVAAAVLVAWCLAKRRPALQMLDLFAAVVPLGQAFGRVGCFLNGCCYGRASCGPFAVAYPAHSVPWQEQLAAGQIGESAARSLAVVPVQLYEAAGCVLLCAALVALHRRLFPPAREGSGPARSPLRGLVLAAYLAGYGALRFAMETLRADERAHPFGGPFTISQAISLAALAAAASLCAAAALRWRRAVRTEGPKA